MAGPPARPRKDNGGRVAIVRPGRRQISGACDAWSDRDPSSRTVDRRRVVGLPGTEDRRRELGLVRRVREVLGLQRKAIALAVLPATRAVQRAVEEVARVELDPRLVGLDRQQASAGRIEQLGCSVELTRLGRWVVEHEVVVIPTSEHELLVAVADALADRVERREIERRSEHRPDLSGRDQSAIDRGEVVGVDPQLVVVDRARPLARQVPVRMVREVDDRGRIGRRERSGSAAGSGCRA